MLCFRVFQLSYFADVDLLLPRPNLGANTGPLVGSVGMVSNHLYSGCWHDLWTKVGDIGLVTSWYVNVVVTEPIMEVL